MSDYRDARETWPLCFARITFHHSLLVFPLLRQCVWRVFIALDRRTDSKRQHSVVCILSYCNVIVPPARPSHTLLLLLANPNSLHMCRGFGWYIWEQCNVSVSQVAVTSAIWHPSLPIYHSIRRDSAEISPVTLATLFPVFPPIVLTCYLLYRSSTLGFLTNCNILTSR